MISLFLGKRDVQWDNVKVIAEDVIVNLPRQINKHRKCDQYYDASEAKVILKELKMLLLNETSTRVLKRSLKECLNVSSSDMS